MTIKFETINSITAITDLLWPPRCAACGQRIEIGDDNIYCKAFCLTCAQSILPVKTPKCPRCAIVFDAGNSDHLCGHCIKKPPSFIATHSFFEYGEAIARAISRLKYEPAPWIQRPLGALMRAALPPLERPDFVVPIPLHPTRLRQRGFNQSALLARHIAKQLNTKINTNILIRINDDPPQARKSRAERINAMSKAFKVLPTKKIIGSKILLFDDVITTTATIESAAEALAQAGCKQIFAISLARTM